MNYLILFQDFLKSSVVFKLLLLLVVSDTFFGCIRAWRCKRWNSSVGIDGVIRKACMLAATLFTAALDLLLNIDLLFFIPEDVARWLGLKTAGTMVLFGLLFIAYELISTLKNMVLCGLPVDGVLKPVYEFLKKYTNELPDMDELAATEESDTE